MNNTLETENLGDRFETEVIEAIGPEAEACVKIVVYLGSSVNTFHVDLSTLNSENYDIVCKLTYDLKVRNGLLYKGHDSRICNFLDKLSYRLKIIWGDYIRNFQIEKSCTQL